MLPTNGVQTAKSPFARIARTSFTSIDQHFFRPCSSNAILKNVKASRQIDLAYLYYLPFCAVFPRETIFTFR